jgi:hypothetical protein
LVILRKLPLLLPVATLLWSCTLEPTERDLRQAVSAAIQDEVSSAIKTKFLGFELMTAVGFEGIDVISVEKISCEPAGKNAFNCEVAVAIAVRVKEKSLASMFGTDGRSKGVHRFRFVKTGAGWILAS